MHALIYFSRSAKKDVDSGEYICTAIGLDGQTASGTVRVVIKVIIIIIAIIIIIIIIITIIIIIIIIKIQIIKNPNQAAPLLGALTFPLLRITMLTI